MIIPDSFFFSDNWNDSSQDKSKNEDNLNIISINRVFDFRDSLFYISQIEEDESSLSNNFNKMIKEQRKENDNKKHIFEIYYCHKKRGRKIKKESKKERHTSSCDDNILRKIQIHYLNFIISFLNDCFYNIFNQKKTIFLKFDYDKKSKVCSKHFKKLKDYKIRDLLENMGISGKIKRYDEGNNKTNLEKLNNNDWFKKVFDMKFLDLFSYYFNNEKPFEKFSFSGKTIIFSEKTKSFYNLIQKNKKLKKDIIRVTKMYNGSNNQAQ